MTIFLKTILYKFGFEPFVRLANRRKSIRYLEIGPGKKRIPGFEGLNIVKNKATDYIADAANGIPLADNSFDLIYSSHFLEHIEWYKTKFVLKEIYRILKKDGVLELWVPDGLKIAKAFVDGELYQGKDFYNDGWWKFNDEHDVCKWFCGRIFTYGDGNKIKGHWNSHLAAFSERYLTECLKESGFTNIRRMTSSECRGYDHGWINLGLRAVK